MFPANFSLINLNRIIITLPGILLAITCHEFAHAYVAYRFGDPTAKHYGRLSLNPIKHIDPFGFILLLIAGFGWAKPVPINPNYFKNRKLGTFLVSIAGVTVNMLLAILLTALLGLAFVFSESQLLIDIIYYGITINIVLAVFNLFPIPPLDGSKILLTFLPERAEYYYYRYQKYSHILLFALIIFNGIDAVLIPVVEFFITGLINILMLFL
ncbi:site-2 protease family protein [Alkaliphilus crotonatoxidans]